MVSVDASLGWHCPLRPIWRCVDAGADTGAVSGASPSEQHRQSPAAATMTDGGEAEDEIQFLRTVSTRFVRLSAAR